jgi:6-phosphogluconolactonase
MAAVTVVADERATAERVAERMTAGIEQAIAARGRACVCLTGGDTPGLLYRLLADTAHPWRGRIDWSRVHLWWGDERHVPPEHRDSNYGMAARALVDHVPIPPAQIHRMRGELPDAGDAAREYEPQLPDTFDLMLLGLGPDAHIASIFPNSPLLSSSNDTGSHLMRTVAVFAPHLQAWRITLTPAAILNARAIVMLVAGAGKADAVYAALEAPPDAPRFPAQLLRAVSDRVEWYVDRAAASRLPSVPNA